MPKSAERPPISKPEKIEQALKEVDISKIELSPAERQKNFENALKLNDQLDKMHDDIRSEVVREKVERPEAVIRDRFNDKMEENFMKIPVKKAAQMLKAISTKASGEYEISDMGQDQVKRANLEYGRTFYSNNGTLVWVDEKGDRYVADHSEVPCELLIQLGFTSKSQNVPFSNDSGEWMMYHNEFSRQMSIREAKKDLEAEPNEMEQEYLQRISAEGTFTPEEYKELMKGRGWPINRMAV